MIRALHMLALFCALIAAHVAQSAPQEGVEYKLISPAQPVMGRKIEVIEFFSYACPHCGEFEPALQAWLKRKPKDVDYRMVPIVFRAQWKAPAKLYYTLETMGIVDQYHQKVYDAFYKEGKELTSDQAVKDWAKGVGIDPVKFAQNYDSFAVDTKLQRGATIAKAYGVQFTPAIAVNGKYYTGPSMAGGHDYAKFFGVLDELIDMERRRAR
jgi:protein dithiol oxidoreductase (disulfide-forming)